MTDSLHVKNIRAKFVYDYLRNNKKGKVLDVGSQSGGFCNELATIGHVPHGIEIMPKSIETARLQFPDIDFKLCDCEKEIPYPNKYFDYVLAGDVIEHLRDVDVFLNETNRVLKVGGKLILSTPMHNRIKNIYIVLFRFEKHFNPEFPHLRFFTLKSLREQLTKRKFEIQKIEYFGRFPLVANTMLVISNKCADASYVNEYQH